MALYKYAYAYYYYYYYYYYYVYIHNIVHCVFIPRFNVQ